MTEKNNPRAAVSRVECVAVLICSVLASLAAIHWSWSHGALLNYGDAVAHLHIARRVFDCHQPRLSQLGSVWLPLPHVLLLPFVQVYCWWANGIAGIIPSALAYLAACIGLYRLARRWLAPTAAALALAFFALNPNLLYLQTTAMTEPLFLCEIIWIVELLVEWRTQLEEAPRKAGRLLFPIAAVLVAAIFTRYDGWVMALLAWSAIGLILLGRGRLRSPAFWLTSALVVAAPIAWFVNEPGNGRCNHQSDCEPEGGRAKPAAPEEDKTNGRPREQGHHPAVVAREDGRHQHGSDRKQQAPGFARGLPSSCVRHSTSQTTTQIISHRNSGSVIAVVCR